MYLSLSWRNLWRNKRRTLIAAASIFFAVILAAVMRSAQRGSYSYMIHSSAQLFTGYLQVQDENYWENRSVDQSMIFSEARQDSIANINNVTRLTPRLESFALASYKTTTKVTQVVGIHPEKEHAMTGLKNKLTEGAYLKPDGNGALIAEGLADMLEVSPGDSIVLYGQGYHGSIAAARLPVTGVVKLPFREMNNGMVYLALPTAQYMYSAYNRITSLPIMIDDIQNLNEVMARINGMIDEQHTVMRWDEMMPDLKQSIQADNASGIIMLAILYIVIAFGVFGTIVMMVSERAREFGILISVGMRKWRLIMVTTIETILVAFTGVISGIIGSIPIIVYLHLNPIEFTGAAAEIYDQLGIEPYMFFSMDAMVFISQALMVLIIALATAVYPFLFIRKLDPVRAVRG